jgi:hypothetical protein
MKNLSSYHDDSAPDYLPLSCSWENTKGKRQPLSAAGSAAHLDEDDDPVSLVRTCAIPHQYSNDVHEC